ncbi:MAG: ATP synthase F1 subunit gamma [Chloroherpetonaceae bacterium]|nr:ATP synthase F1 subunit gamma [Chloroherpetonaceae bacterium]MCS7210832.1 ATP synthase F1 subunit gamma [Chloroherpetonaceae bacterium]MDW8020499.1 ATP synthase F1 subunit gamma [Chloroherpetonaceae bacterium]
MATLRELRTRIKGIRNTQQVTKAMRMVAAAKLRRSQDRAIAARPYANALKKMLASIVAKIDVSEFSLLTPRPVTKRILAVVVAADRGLCGAFNANLLKMARETFQGEYQEWAAKNNLLVMPVGRRSVDFFAKQPYPVVERFSGVFQKLEFETAKAIADKATALYASGEVDRVVLFYNEFKTVLAPQLRKEVFLPIEPPKTQPTLSGDYIFEPDPTEIIGQLLPLYLANQIWRMLLESNAAEQAARMTAMDAASNNAKELLRILGITYNRVRQASITKEIIEIISGADALQNK